jgi:adenosylcobinamide-GDP ribazoletransferase
MRWSGLRLSVSLLTVIPLRSTVPPASDASAAVPGAPAQGRPPLARATVAAAMAWAPAVGLLLGVAATAVLLIADHPLGTGSLTAAGLAIASLALLSRGLHLDGLADLADGLGSGKPAAGALEVMRRSDIGPFGTVTLILTLLIQVAALSHAEAAGPGRGAAALITAVVTGRLAITWACRPGVAPARPDGLGALVAGSVRAPVAAGVTVAVLGGGDGLGDGHRRAARLDAATGRRRGSVGRLRHARARGAPARRHHRRRARRRGRGGHDRRPAGRGDGQARLTGPLAQPDPRIGDRQRDVGDQVAYHRQHRADQRVGDEHRIVLVAEAAVEQQAEPVVVEHELGDEVARE